MAQDRERHQERRTHAQSARRDAMATPRGPLRARSRRDLLDQCSAYACPMRAYARLPRKTASTCRTPRNRSPLATPRRAHLAYACVRRIDKAPRKSPENLESSTGLPARRRWSQRCAYAKERSEPDELVAGVTRPRTTIGFQARRSCRSRPRAYALHMAALLDRVPVGDRAPRNSGPSARHQLSPPENPSGHYLTPRARLRYR